MGILRTILALAVVVYHSFTIFGLRLSGGQVAVESFFIISGFYMAFILNEKYVGVGSYRTFLLSRFYRIFPVYWIVLVAALLLSLIGYYGFNHAYYLSRFFENKECLSFTTMGYFLMENILIIGQDVLYFLRLDEGCHPKLMYYVLSYKHLGYQYLLVPQAWSISLELLFYCIAPFIVRKKIGWQLAIIILSLGAKIMYATQFNLSLDPWTYRFFPFELGFFMLGSITYQGYIYLKNKAISPQIGYALLALCIISICGIDELAIEAGIKNTLFYSLIFVSIPFIFLAFKNSSTDRYIGELSFSLYISHHLIVSLFRGFFYSHHEWMMYYGYAVVMTSLAVAIIFQKLIIKPLEILRLKRILNS
jgi:peptidoglycan/LPS O-acetylase OafA/YrhL